MIRDAHMSDYDTLKPFFDEVHKITPFADIPLDESHMRRMFAMATSMPVFFCKVSVNHEDEIQGMFAGYIETNIWGAKVATDILVVVGRETDKLIDTFKKWAHAKDADLTIITELTNNSRYKKLIKRSKFHRIGTVYIEEK